jgi:hypothetical protein
MADSFFAGNGRIELRDGNGNLKFSTFGKTPNIYRTITGNVTLNAASFGEHSSQQTVATNIDSDTEFLLAQIFIERGGQSYWVNCNSSLTRIVGNVGSDSILQIYLKIDFLLSGSSLVVKQYGYIFTSFFTIPSTTVPFRVFLGRYN